MAEDAEEKGPPMATLRQHPPSRWRWVLWTFPGRTNRRSIADAYLAPNERVLSVSQRHPVSLSSAVFLWLFSLMVGFGTGVSYNQAHARYELSYLGAGIILLGTVFLGWKVWRSRTDRYVLTERRVVRSIKYEGAKSLTVSEILDRFKERKVGLSVEAQYDPNKKGIDSWFVSEQPYEYEYFKSTIKKEFLRSGTNRQTIRITQASRIHCKFAANLH